MDRPATSAKRKELTDALLVDLRQQLAKVRALASTLESAIDSLERISEGIDVPELLSAGSDFQGQTMLPSALERPQAKVRSVDSPSRRKRKTQYDYLVDFAKSNGGVVRVSDARDMFVNLGITKSDQRTVYTNIHHLLRTSDEFEPSGRGEFSLKDYQNAHDDHM